MAESKPEFEIEDLPSIWKIATDFEWLIDDFLSEASVGLLTGESGCGKSTLTLALADAVAHGSKFLNKTCKQRHVLIIDKENGLGVYHERLARLGLEEDDKLHVWGLWSDPEPKGPDAKAIARFADRHKPLIVFDSLIAFHPGSEQDASETRQYLQMFRNLTKYGATVLVIHHTGKGENTKKYRGSSDILASIDVGWVMNSRANLQGITLSPFKSREGATEAIKVGFDGVRFSTLSNDLQDLVRETIEKNPGINETKLISQLVGVVPERKLMDILHEGLLNGSIIKSKGARNANCYALR